MKAYIDVDKCYPIYDISRRQFGNSKEVEIDDEEYRKYIRALDEFFDMQQKLKKLFIREINNAS